MLQCVYPLCVVVIQAVANSSCLSAVRNRDLVGLLTVAHDCLCLQAWNFVCVGVGRKRGLPHGALAWQLNLLSPAWGSDGFFVFYVQRA